MGARTVVRTVHGNSDNSRLSIKPIVVCMVHYAGGKISAGVLPKSAKDVLLWLPCVIGQAIIFCPVVSSSIFFFSSPNLSSRRLDVYHTSRHGVAAKGYF